MADKEELLECIDPYTGENNGNLVQRTEAHLNGLWHGCFHVWFISNVKDIPVIYIQQRSINKDFCGGLLDVTVGGHYVAGEKVIDGLREVEEEMNMSISFKDLIYLGRRVSMYHNEKGFNNEILDVFLYETTIHLEDIKFDPQEVSGLFAIPIQEMYKIFKEKNYRYTASGTIFCNGIYKENYKVISKEDFIPTIDLYPYKIAIQAERYYEGKTDFSV